MEQFPDGAHVRLRSRVRRKYLHAAPYGIDVFLSPKSASCNDVPFVLLHGAAYGRYLAASDAPASPDHRGQRVVQGVYDDPEENAIAWTAVEAADNRDDVLLRHVSGRLLRANGRRKTWKNGVSVEHPDNQSTMMHWVVEALQPQLQTPAIVPPIIPHVRCFLGCFQRRIAPFPERTIRCVRADYFGNFNNDCSWATFQFEGRSVFLLRWDVMSHVGFNITVCTRAGRYGRLTPLITDLPRILLPMDIIALTTNSPGENFVAITFLCEVCF